MGEVVSPSARTQAAASLLAQVRVGDDAAREQLCSLCLSIMLRWTRGHLPLAARDFAETADPVQIILLYALARIDRFESRHEAAFLANLRTALLNSLRNEIARSARHGWPVAVNEIDRGPSDRGAWDDPARLCEYERGLATLSPDDRAAVVLRIEFGFSFEEIAAAMERPSTNAARMLVHRAVDALSKPTQRDQDVNVLVEATDRYEREAVACLCAYGIWVSQINPRQARVFAWATGQLAKTDSIGADDLVMMVVGLRERLRRCAPLAPWRGKLAESDQDDWACTLDNVTSLMWEVKTDDNALRDQDWTYAWYNPASPNGSPGTEGHTLDCNGTLDELPGNTEHYVNAINAAGLSACADLTTGACPNSRKCTA